MHLRKKSFEFKHLLWRWKPLFFLHEWDHKTFTETVFAVIMNIKFNARFSCASWDYEYQETSFCTHHNLLTGIWVSTIEKEMAANIKLSTLKSKLSDTLLIGLIFSQIKLQLSTYWRNPLCETYNLKRNFRFWYVLSIKSLVLL